ncbi:MAG: hypothetical protein IKY68_00070 [Alistipes sp.]|nr:hypothetical protein [Alistipes sp.]
MKDLFYALTLALICWGFGGCTGDAANDDPSPEYAELLPGRWACVKEVYADEEPYYFDSGEFTFEFGERGMGLFLALDDELGQLSEAFRYRVQGEELYLALYYGSELDEEMCWHIDRLDDKELVVSYAEQDLGDDMTVKLYLERL